MGLKQIPPPLQHPVMGRDGLITVPWASYFRALSTTVDNGGYMLQSVYDPTASGSVVDSDKLGGQLPAYYLALANATGFLKTGSTQWNLRIITASTFAAAGDWCDCEASSGAITVSMPNPADLIGVPIMIRKADASANTVTIDGLVNGATSTVLTIQYTALTMVSNGSEWCIV